ncbi:hypothetical protein DLAC_05372 [Tieghemostelium lacteum]|uniref:Uncharacterized protein n=1 Tax=Tieghemostelium lacteum TaxID=361077 RepID=A0A151ZFZ8_TIELA|nr:hypothetical protein DLAC_05372 [Tieghemostelium lacteum]|eukprot:KYQ92790.1 hypothetical protein DLAC_05372 [Tieghemostelium lacteum]
MWRDSWGIDSSLLDIVRKPNTYGNTIVMIHGIEREFLSFDRRFLLQSYKTHDVSPDGDTVSLRKTISVEAILDINNNHYKNIIIGLDIIISSRNSQTFNTLLKPFGLVNFKMVKNSGSSMFVNVENGRYTIILPELIQHKSLVNVYLNTLGNNMPRESPERVVQYLNENSTIKNLRITIKSVNPQDMSNNNNNSDNVHLQINNNTLQRFDTESGDIIKLWNSKSSLKYISNNKDISISPELLPLINSYHHNLTTFQCYIDEFNIPKLNETLKLLIKLEYLYLGYNISRDKEAREHKNPPYNINIEEYKTLANVIGNLQNLTTIRMEVRYKIIPCIILQPLLCHSKLECLHLESPRRIDLPDEVVDLVCKFQQIKQFKIVGHISNNNLFRIVYQCLNLDSIKFECGFGGISYKNGFDKDIINYYQSSFTNSNLILPDRLSIELNEYRNYGIWDTYTKLINYK